MWVFLTHFFLLFCMFEILYYESWGKSHRPTDGQIFHHLGWVIALGYLIMHNNLGIAMKMFCRYD